MIAYARTRFKGMDAHMPQPVRAFDDEMVRVRQTVYGPVTVRSGGRAKSPIASTVRPGVEGDEERRERH
jgi:hypothetical protein